MGAMALGSRCLVMMPRSSMPTAREASMNSCSRSVRNSPRTRRETVIQPVMPRMKMMMPICPPGKLAALRKVESTMISIKTGTASMTSARRMITPSTHLP
ncbi:hypothetical protein D3C78_1766000 [compost metagenome]